MRRAALSAALIAGLAPPAAALECHTALALALDASDSVDAREAALQRRGLAAALTDPEVIAALAPSEGYAAAVMAFEWSDPGEERVIAGWALLDSAAAAAAFAARIEATPPTETGGDTGVGSALAFAVEAHGAAPAPCDRRVIDVSGDGPGNAGPAPSALRAEGLFDGYMINGLAIRQAPPNYMLQQPTRDPLPYYEAEVRHGPGAFVLVADDYEDFADAMRRKLLKELRPRLAGDGG